jgi:hypothetical protein
MAESKLLKTANCPGWSNQVQMAQQVGQWRIASAEKG